MPGFRGRDGYVVRDERRSPMSGGGRKGGKIMAGDRDITLLVEIHERVVAQEAYGPLKTAEEIIGLLNTAIPRGDNEEEDRRRRSARRDVAELANPFDNEHFRDQLSRYVTSFCNSTDSNERAANQILDLIDTDMAQGRLSHARAKITDLSLFFMDQVRRCLKRKYPW